MGGFVGITATVGTILTVGFSVGCVVAVAAAVAIAVAVAVEVAVSVTIGVAVSMAFNVGVSAIGVYVAVETWIIISTVGGFGGSVGVTGAPHPTISSPISAI